MLFTPEELKALIDLFNRVPLSLAEQQFVIAMMNRLAEFCQPPQASQEPETEETDDN